MSKKLVAMLIVVMLLGFTFTANAQVVYYDVGMSPSVVSGSAPCGVAAYLAGGVVGIYVTAHTLNPVAGTIVGQATEAVFDYACEEIADWASNSDYDQQARKYIDGTVYYKGYCNSREKRGYGIVTSVNTWLNIFHIRDNGDGRNYDVGYGWNEYGGYFIRPLMIVDENTVQ